MRRGIGRLRAGGSGFSPASLFVAGVQGVWYDPSDLSSMFQDTAGTTPAAVNSAVARVNDKSGNGKNLTQATAASRPILRQSGSTYWLEFDGLDDWLSSSSFSLASTSSMMATARATAGAAAIGNIFDGVGVSTNRMVVGTMSSTNYRIFAGSNVVGGARDTSDHVILANWNGASSTAELDKSQIISGNPGTNVLTGGIVVGSDSVDGASQPFAGRIHQCLAVARALTAGEKANLYTYFGNKAGLTL